MEWAVLNNMIMKNKPKHFRTMYTICNMMSWAKIKARQFFDEFY